MRSATSVGPMAEDESQQPLLESSPEDDSVSKKDVPSWSEEAFQIVKLCGPAVVQLCFQQAGSQLCLRSEQISCRRTVAFFTTDNAGLW